LIAWKLSNDQRVELYEDGVTRLVQALVPGVQAAQIIKLTDDFYLELDAVEMLLPFDEACIIGRSLLKQAVFVYDGLSGTFALRV